MTVSRWGIITFLRFVLKEFCYNQQASRSSNSFHYFCIKKVCVGDGCVLFFSCLCFFFLNVQQKRICIVLLVETALWCYKRVKSRALNLFRTVVDLHSGHYYENLPVNPIQDICIQGMKSEFNSFSVQIFMTCPAVICLNNNFHLGNKLFFSLL